MLNQTFTIQISNPETNETLGCREQGEVRIKGLAVFQGYVGMDPRDIFDDEGYYKTGDIAYYDEDGYFYIVDRIKELIKYKGWQVSITATVKNIRSSIKQLFENVPISSKIYYYYLCPTVPCVLI